MLKTCDFLHCKERSFSALRSEFTETVQCCNRQGRGTSSLGRIQSQLNLNHTLAPRRQAKWWRFPSAGQGGDDQSCCHGILIACWQPGSRILQRDSQSSYTPWIVLSHCTSMWSPMTAKGDMERINEGLQSSVAKSWRRGSSGAFLLNCTSVWEGFGEDVSCKLTAGWITVAVVSALAFITIWDMDC